MLIEGEQQLLLGNLCKKVGDSSSPLWDGYPGPVPGPPEGQIISEAKVYTPSVASETAVLNNIPKLKVLSFGVPVLRLRCLLINGFMMFCAGFVLQQVMMEGIRQSLRGPVTDMARYLGLIVKVYDVVSLM